MAKISPSVSYFTVLKLFSLQVYKTIWIALWFISCVHCITWEARKNTSMPRPQFPSGFRPPLVLVNQCIKCIAIEIQVAPSAYELELGLRWSTIFPTCSAISRVWVTSKLPRSMPTQPWSGSWWTTLYLQQLKRGERGSKRHSAHSLSVFPWPRFNRSPVRLSLSLATPWIVTVALRVTSKHESWMAMQGVSIIENRLWEIALNTTRRLLISKIVNTLNRYLLYYSHIGLSPYALLQSINSIHSWSVHWAFPLQYMSWG